MFSRVLNENDLKFLSFLRERIQHLYRVLKDTGSIYVHIDWHLGHYVKIILDDIFGKKNFINEIIWSYNTGGIPKK
jgi:adenine-specific DNA-methyltransferase